MEGRKNDKIITTSNSVFISFGLKSVWEVRRFLVALYRADEEVVPIPQTKQTRGTLGTIIRTTIRK